MNRSEQWSIDQVMIDLEDLDVNIRAVNADNFAEITVRFRMDRFQLGGDAATLRTRLEFAAASKVLDFAAFLARAT